MVTPQKRPSDLSEHELEERKKPRWPDVEPFFPYDRIVTILAGPECERFEIHHNLVCQYPFFKAAYQGRFIESGGVLKLPEHEPEVVRFLMYWLYTKKLNGYYYPATTVPSISDLRAEVEAELQEANLPPLGTEAGCEIIDSDASDIYDMACYRDTPFDSLVNLYLLAEYLQIPCLKDQIVNSLVDIYGYCSNIRVGYMTLFWQWSNEDRPAWAPDPVPSINAAWKALPTDSHLCKLLIILFCDNGMGIKKGPKDLEQYERLDPSFLCAAFMEVQQRWEGNMSTSKWLSPGVLCAYHDHDGTPCTFHDEEPEQRAEKQLKPKA
ncbi:MAG: hypothetical protein Q9209_001953 [Squamulea sp. 1 TL-2023]